jgi:hypothetical protein
MGPVESIDPMAINAARDDNGVERILKLRVSTTR